MLRFTPPPPTLPWAEAFEKAQACVEALRPHVRTLKAVGPLRRKEATVEGLIFVVEPYTHPTLLGEPEADLERVKLVMRTWGETVRVKGAVLQTEQADGFPYTVVIAHPNTWGYALVAHTGPSEFLRTVHARMRERDLRADGLQIFDAEANPIAFETEEDLFQALDLPVQTPAQRGKPVPDPLDDLDNPPF